MWDWLDCWAAGAFIEFAWLGKSIWDRLLFQSDFIDTACLWPTSTLEAVSGDMFHIVLLFIL